MNRAENLRAEGEGKTNAQHTSGVLLDHLPTLAADREAVWLHDHGDPSAASPYAQGFDRSVKPAQAD